MRHPLVLFGLLLCLTISAKAQQTIEFADFRKNIGKTATLCDSVYSVSIFNDTLTFISMGGNYPNQKFTVAIKGNKVSLDWANLKKKRLCVTGVLELYKNTIQVVAAQPSQIIVSK